MLANAVKDFRRVTNRLVAHTSSTASTTAQIQSSVAELSQSLTSLERNTLSQAKRSPSVVAPSVAFYPPPQTIPLWLMTPPPDRQISMPGLPGAIGMVHLVDDKGDANQASPPPSSQTLPLLPHASSFESEEENGGAELAEKAKETVKLSSIDSGGFDVVPQPKGL